MKSRITIIIAALLLAAPASTGAHICKTCRPHKPKPAKPCIPILVPSPCTSTAQIACPAVN